MDQPEAGATRPRAEALDEILGQPFRVLDDGFVRALDYLGTDESIVQAARVSYGRGSKSPADDRRLIRYLMRHRHTTPFEMCEIKLHVRVPMDCWRQWIRHRTANVNEYSTRYSTAIDSMQATAPGEWRLQGMLDKQGSAGARLDPGLGEEMSRTERELQERAREVYRARLAAGIAREQARKDLPLSTYTEAYWKIDLHNLLSFLSLRMDDHAQFEIRSYARTIGETIVARWCPMEWEAFVDYRVLALSLSRMDAEIVARVARGDRDGALEAARSFGWIPTPGAPLKGHRERTECENKLRRLGLNVPW